MDGCDLKGETWFFRVCGSTEKFLIQKSEIERKFEKMKSKKWRERQLNNTIRTNATNGNKR